MVPALLLDERVRTVAAQRPMAAIADIARQLSPSVKVRPKVNFVQTRIRVMPVERFPVVRARSRAGAASEVSSSVGISGVTG